MATSRPLTVTVHIDGLRETLAAMNRLPKDANAALRAKSLHLSRLLATRAAAAARAEGRQGPLVATTVRPKLDRVPTVIAGGTSPRLGRGRARPDQLLFGTEFGSDRYKQFGKRHVGRGSYWFFRTIEAESPATARAWAEAADEIVRRFSQGGRP